MTWRNKARSCGPDLDRIRAAGATPAQDTAIRKGRPVSVAVATALRTWSSSVTSAPSSVTPSAGAADAMSQTVPDDAGQRGVIVCTASIAAYDGQVGQIAYAASKGGVVGLTLSAARDLASFGIRVCTIAPGLIDTPLLGTLPDDQRTALAQSVLFPKRLGTAADFASLALELVRNTYMNGEVIRMDAGIRMPPK